ncbi:hypothetical protein BDA99DRAFT_524959 [Phascolomyces articulosus]|uniref:Uncharacterized protein n=1 Tax=Phascolomyces articulosus TaxID=60185 RepID=A0AAD5JQ32_9FUNG|nr:hypothetical protein BDA99DRAFT_524959 [Phascolomyces articulosus]
MGDNLSKETYTPESMTQSNNSANATKAPAKDRTPLVIPASPPLKARKKPIPWDTDVGTDNNDSSVERLIKWLLRDDVYKQWQEGVAPSGETITKKALTEEFLEELINVGIDYRKVADIQTKIYQLEHDFGKARNWIARNKPDEKESSNQTESTRTTVLQKCKHYYRLEPIFGKYLDFPSKKDLESLEAQTPPRKTTTTSPPPSSSTSSPTPVRTVPPSTTSTPAPKRTVFDLFEALVKNQHSIVPSGSNNGYNQLIANPQVNLSPPPPPSRTNNVHTSMPTTSSVAAVADSTSSDPSSQMLSLLALEKSIMAEASQQSIDSKERVSLERLRLKEKEHNDRMEVKKRKLDLEEMKMSQDYDIQKRKATAEILASHAQLIAELRALGLSNADIVDYIRRSENA